MWITCLHYECYTSLQYHLQLWYVSVSSALVSRVIISVPNLLYVCLSMSNNAVFM